MAKQSLLVLQHVNCEGLGYFKEPIIESGLNIKHIKLFNNELIPKTIDNIDALVVLGGYMNVYEKDKFPYLADENLFIKKAAENNMPILGVCLGAQLLAKALGARVYKNKVKEIGFYDIKLISPKTDDRLFSKLPQNLKVFQWHGDTFDLPKNAKLLSTSDLCTNQAFIYKNAYGLQFHLETTPKMVEEWSNIYKDELSEFDSSKVINFKTALASKPYAVEIINNFITLIKAART